MITSRIGAAYLWANDWFRSKSTRWAAPFRTLTDKIDVQVHDFLRDISPALFSLTFR